MCCLDRLSKSPTLTRLDLGDLKNPKFMQPAVPMMVVGTPSPKASMTGVLKADTQRPSPHAIQSCTPGRWNMTKKQRRLGTAEVTWVASEWISVRMTVQLTFVFNGQWSDLTPGWS